LSKSHADGILLIYHRPIGAPDASTVAEHIGALERHSRFRICKINTDLGFPPQLRRMQFPIIVLHYSLFGSGQYPMSHEFIDYVGSCRSSHKIAFFQDEYYFCQKRFRLINDLKIDCIYTLLEPENVEQVYGKYTAVPRVISTLTGYVSDDLIAAARRFGIPDEGRSVDVGYRGRQLPPYMGREAREKTEIAERFAEMAAPLSLALDVATKERERLYGRDWYKFLARCRACLGVEAGVSVFDLEGQVYARYEQLLQARPQATFDELAAKLAPVMDRWENRVYYRTISPRHFESAAFHVCQVLYEGRYSGVLESGRHYIPLKKDFSNFDDVVQALRDPEKRRRITDAAYEDLIASGRYSYRRFIGEFDEELQRSGFSATRQFILNHPVARYSVAKRPVRMIRWTIEQLLLRFVRFLWGWRFPGRPGVVTILRPFLKPLVDRYRRRRLARMS
jgi:hypothetical protein